MNTHARSQIVFFSRDFGYYLSTHPIVTGELKMPLL